MWMDKPRQCLHFNVPEGWVCFLYWNKRTILKYYTFHKYKNHYVRRLNNSSKFYPSEVRIANR